MNYDCSIFTARIHTHFMKLLNKPGTIEHNKNIYEVYYDKGILSYLFSLILGSEYFIPPP